MFARFSFQAITDIISAVTDTVYQYITQTAQRFAETYLVTTPPAFTSENNIQTSTIRYLFSRWHLVYIRQTSQTESILKPLMDLPEPDARSMYNVLPQITNSSFFLAMNNDKAEMLRRRLVTCLRKNHANFMRNADQDIGEIIAYLHTQQKFTSVTQQFIKYKIRFMITRTLTGLQLTNAVQDALGRIEVNLSTNSFSMHPALPEYIRLMFSYYRNLKHEINTVITQFLREELLRLARDNHCEHTLLNEIIEELYPNQPLSDLVRNESILNELANHPDLRVCISGAVAADNLTTCVFTAINNLYQIVKPTYGNSKTHANMINDELNAHLQSHDEISLHTLLNDLPRLNAFWLECLHYKPPMPDIVRITRAGITVDDIQIPPQSMVIYKFACADVNRPDKYLTHLFRPIRHESDTVKLNKNTFTPFGAGSRICPAIRLSELIFKKIAIALANEVKIDENNNIEVIKPQTITHTKHTFM